MTRSVEYEHDGLSEQQLRCWFSSCGRFGEVDVYRVAFEQPTHEGWSGHESDHAGVTKFNLIVASAQLTTAAKL
jgi:hypothetical protein